MKLNSPETMVEQAMLDALNHNIVLILNSKQYHMLSDYLDNIDADLSNYNESISACRKLMSVWME